MSRNPRNAGLPIVPTAVLRKRILAHMAKWPDEAIGGTATLGEIAFPERRFNSRQGAALAIGKVVHGMHKDGLIRSANSGWIITMKGRKAAVAKDEK